MRSTIKKILKEELLGDRYRSCDHFTGPSQREFCKKLETLRGWLYKDLGLRDMIDSKLATIINFSNVNEEYQYPLEILAESGKYTEIKKIEGKYIHERLKNVGMVLDEKGEWHHVNKLNTNYSDLAELLTELFIKGGVLEGLNDKNELGIKNYLTSIKDKLPRLLDKYFHIDEYKNFIRNTKYQSDQGKHAEDIVVSTLTKYGVDVIYQGGNGDFIDMLFGCDLIIKAGDNYYTVQVKNTESGLTEAMSDNRYKRIDCFSAPTDYGIILYLRDGKSFMIGLDGKVIKQ
jgi:hypothetical protein